MSRRFDYGTSEGMLQLLHPGRRKQMVVPVALAAAAALAVLSFLTRSWPFVAMGAGVLLVDAARLSAKLRRERLRAPVPINPRRAAACLREPRCCCCLAFHLTRYYAPALIVAGFAWPRLGSLFAILAVWSGAVNHAVRRPTLRFPAFFGLYLAEHLSYGAGVFWGCLRAGAFGSYRPLISAKD